MTTWNLFGKLSVVKHVSHKIQMLYYTPYSLIAFFSLSSRWFCLKVLLWQNLIFNILVKYFLELIVIVM